MGRRSRWVEARGGLILVYGSRIIARAYSCEYISNKTAITPMVIREVPWPWHSKVHRELVRGRPYCFVAGSKISPSYVERSVFKFVLLLSLPFALLLELLRDYSDARGIMRYIPMIGISMDSPLVVLPRMDVYDVSVSQTKVVDQPCRTPVIIFRSVPFSFMLAISFRSLEFFTSTIGYVWGVQFFRISSYS